MRHRETLNPIREEFLLKGRVHGWPHFHIVFQLFTSFCTKLTLGCDLLHIICNLENTAWTVHSFSLVCTELETHTKKGRHKSNPKAGSLVGLGFRAGMGYKE